jgi:hypothetical protein
MGAIPRAAFREEDGGFKKLRRKPCLPVSAARRSATPTTTKMVGKIGNRQHIDQRAARRPELGYEQR